MITLSTKYALSALLFLAGVDSDDYFAMETLSAETGVPRPYLAKLMKLLAAKNIVLSKKGLGGGFKLDQKRKGLTLYDVCVALDDPVVKEVCFLGRRQCSDSKACAFHPSWSEMKKQILKFTRDFKIT